MGEVLLSLWIGSGIDSVFKYQLFDIELFY